MDFQTAILAGITGCFFMMVVLQAILNKAVYWFYLLGTAVFSLLTITSAYGKLNI